MTKVLISMAAFTATALLVVSTAVSQPPGGGEKGGAKGGDKGGEKGGPPKFELGQVFPPPLVEELNLTPMQQKELEKIQKELKTKLDKLLTAEQKKAIENFRPRGPGGPGGPGGNDKGGPGGKGGDKGAPGGKGGDRPPIEKGE